MCLLQPEGPGYSVGIGSLRAKDNKKAKPKTDKAALHHGLRALLRSSMLCATNAPLRHKFESLLATVNFDLSESQPPRRCQIHGKLTRSPCPSPVPDTLSFCSWHYSERTVTGRHSNSFSLLNFESLEVPADNTTKHTQHTQVPADDPTKHALYHRL